MATRRTTKRPSTLFASLAISVTLLASGCSTAPTTGTIDSAELGAAAARLPGVYEGVIPCADCEGIRTALYLKATGTYSRVSAYIGRSAANFDEAGVWTVESIDEKGVATVRFDPMQEGIETWRAKSEGDYKLRLLDRSGQVIEGTLSDRYLLQRH